jgi:hypothetical protein
LVRLVLHPVEGRQGGAEVLAGRFDVPVADDAAMVLGRPPMPIQRDDTLRRVSRQ